MFGVLSVMLVLLKRGSGDEAAEIVGFFAVVIVVGIAALVKHVGKPAEPTAPVAVAPVLTPTRFVPDEDDDLGPVERHAAAIADRFGGNWYHCAVAGVSHLNADGWQVGGKFDAERHRIPKIEAFLIFMKRINSTKVRPQRVRAPISHL